MTLDQIVKQLTGTPFFFIGSGFSKRYYNLPSWEELLKYFISKISNDEFAFQKYYNEAASLLESNSSVGLHYAKIASIVEKEFNSKWFNNEIERTTTKKYLNFIKNKTSPFKAELAEFIENNSTLNPEYKHEIQLFHNLSSKSISGIITTNYDMFLEQNTDEYKTFLGQDQLLFSNLNYIGEIYKIHRSVSDPNSIVITYEDYQKFQEKSKYLAAKLMTIFVENPIVFIGYSLNDPNISSIIKSIITCLDKQHLEKIKNHFIYVEWNPNINDNIEITTHTIQIHNQLLEMTLLKTNNFALLFEAFLKKKHTLPVKILRLFKNELYEYTISNTPTSKINIAGIDNPNINDDELVLAIAAPSTLAINGLSGLCTFDFYKHIVLDDIKFPAEKILEFAYPNLIRSNNVLPLNKLLSLSSKKYENIEAKRLKSFNSIISKTIVKERKKKVFQHRSVKGILDEFNSDHFKMVKFLSYLKENEINLNDLENFLVHEFKKDDLQELFKKKQGYSSDLYRLVRIYDFMKYSNKISLYS